MNDMTQLIDEVESTLKPYFTEIEKNSIFKPRESLRCLSCGQSI
ncbi:Uncharacterised protein [Staphylococcus gallinarum]|uniref:Uncharacterized protein n=1 Tax=Staphylococcus gallinarum TaxID=1293 RepID=A0A380FHN9_STAGA|nr:Uncharacterised protein [Staphylococcus gallinarum]